MAYITQYSNSVPVVKFPLDQYVLSIGQAIEADICVPEEGIADKHAQLEITQQTECFQFQIITLDNAQISVNGNNVSQATLKDGDWIVIGDIEFQFTDDGVNEIKLIAMDNSDSPNAPANVIELSQDEPESGNDKLQDDKVSADKEKVSNKSFSRRLRSF